MFSFSSSKNQVIEKSNNEEIDFKLIFNFFNRNKKFITSFTLIFIILGYIYSFFPKRIWEGQFQIVLTSGKKGSGFSSGNPLLSLSGISQTNDLKTEVGILESPSVLMPAYKIKINKNYLNSTNDNDGFLKWKNKKLNIGLKKGTAILNISYKDKDKNIILPILEKMSSTYQEYSEKRKKRKNKITEDYLNSQINLFRKKSSNSLKIAQEFAIDQDLVYLEPNQENNFNESFSEINLNSPSEISNKDRLKINNIKSNSFLPQNIDIENVRVQAANEIRKIDLQLKKIKNLEETSSDLQFIGSTLPALVNAGLPQTLQKIENEIVEAKSKYTDKDRNLIRLIEKRKYLVDVLKKRSINFLKSMRLENEAKLEAASRPKGVLLKYKELIRNASRDENTLIKLENELRLVQLEKSKKEDPWELITEPTLLNRPADNLKTSILILSFLVGLSLATGFKIFQENKSGIIFDLKNLFYLISQIPSQFFETINFNDTKEMDDKILFLNEFINSKDHKKINMILIGQINEEKVNKIKNLLGTENKKINLITSLPSLKNQDQLNINFLFLSLGISKFIDIENLIKYQKLFNLNFDGIILI